MIKRILFVAAVAAATMVGVDAAKAQSSSVGFASYRQTVTGTEPFVYMGNGSTPAMISVDTDINYEVTEPSFLRDLMAANYPNATFTLTAESFSPAQTSPFPFQNGFSGTFSMSQDGTLIASGTFDSATLVQAAGGQASLAIPVVSFASDIFKPLTNLSFSIDVAGTGTLVDAGSSFNNFDGVVSGTFAGTVIPEPASLAMAGLGMLALPAAAFAARRRRAKA